MTAEPAFSRWGCPHWPVLSPRRRCEKLRQRRERPPTQSASVGGRSEHRPFIRPLFKVWLETFQETLQGQGLKEQAWITPSQVPDPSSDGPPGHLSGTKRVPLGFYLQPPQTKNMVAASSYTPASGSKAEEPEMLIRLFLHHLITRRSPRTQSSNPTPTPIILLFPKSENPRPSSQGSPVLRVQSFLLPRPRVPRSGVGQAPGMGKPPGARGGASRGGAPRRTPLGVGGAAVEPTAIEARVTWTARRSR